MTHRIRWHKPTDSRVPIFPLNIHYIAPVRLSDILNVPHILQMAYIRSPILIGDNKRKYSSHEPWIHGTIATWAPHVWCCVTDFSSLTALLHYLVTYTIRAQSPSPDDKYQFIYNFVNTFPEPLDYTYFIFDRCVIARLCRQSPDCAGRLRVLGTWERTHVHFWQESKRLSFDPFSYYLPCVLYVIHQTWGARMNLGNVSNCIENVLYIFRILLL